MITEQEAVAQLLKQVGQVPYKQSASWVSTRTFTLDTQQRKTKAPFVLDERFVTLAVPDSKHTSKQTPL